MKSYRLCLRNVSRIWPLHTTSTAVTIFSHMGFLNSFQTGLPACPSFQLWHSSWCNLVLQPQSDHASPLLKTFQWLISWGIKVKVLALVHTKPYTICHFYPLSDFISCFSPSSRYQFLWLPCSFPKMTGKLPDHRPLPLALLLAPWSFPHLRCFSQVSSS